MKARAIAALAFLLMMALTVVGMGCVAATGGGWFVNEADEALITFGFNAKPVEGEQVSARGQFQLVYHGTRPPTRIHGKFTATYWDTIEDFEGYAGECSINGEDGHTFIAGLVDSGSEIVVAVYLDGGVDPAYQGVLGGGTIRGHAP